LKPESNRDRAGTSRWKRVAVYIYVSIYLNIYRRDGVGDASICTYGESQVVKLRETRNTHAQGAQLCVL
jgi:hypothetical protein